MEPPNDPHLDPNHGPYSKDEPFPNPTDDLMYYAGPDPGHPEHSISLNSCDWEFLRQHIAPRRSTGPTEPFIWWQDLEGHDLRPFPAVGKNTDGRQEVFVLGGDRAIYHRWETSLGGAWSD